MHGDGDGEAGRAHMTLQLLQRAQVDGHRAAPIALPAPPPGAQSRRAGGACPVAQPPQSGTAGPDRARSAAGRRACARAGGEPGSPVARRRRDRRGCAYTRRRPGRRPSWRAASRIEVPTGKRPRRPEGVKMTSGACRRRSATSPPPCALTTPSRRVARRRLAQAPQPGVYAGHRHPLRYSCAGCGVWR